MNNDNNLESALKDFLKKRNNQNFTYRKEYFFPLIKEEEKSLKKIKIKGNIDKKKYEDLLKNYNNNNI